MAGGCRTVSRPASGFVSFRFAHTLDDEMKRDETKRNETKRKTKRNEMAADLTRPRADPMVECVRLSSVRALVTSLFSLLN